MRIYAAIVALLVAGLASATARSSPSPGSQQPPAAKAAATPAMQPTSPSKIDPAKEADIRRLLELLGTKALMAQTMESMMGNLKPMLANALPAGEYREKLVDLFFAKFHAKADLQQLLDLAVSAYDKHFTHQEIKGLIKFYETPPGQKASSVLPQLVTEMRDAGRTWGEKLGRDCMQEVLEEHPDLAEAMQAAGKAAQPR